MIGHSTSRLPPSRPAHTTIRSLFRYLFRSLFLFFIFYFLIVSFSFYRHSFIGQSSSRLLPSRPAHTTIRFLLPSLLFCVLLFSCVLSCLVCRCLTLDTCNTLKYTAPLYCCVLSILSSSSLFILILSLSRGTPSLGSQRLACHLHDPRTRHSGFLSAIFGPTTLSL